MSLPRRRGHSKTRVHQSHHPNGGSSQSTHLDNGAHTNSVTVTENSYAQDCYSFLSTENHLEIKRQTQDTGHKIERLHILLMNLSQTPGECLPRGVLHTESKGNHEVMSFPYMELIT